MYWVALTDAAHTGEMQNSVTETTREHFGITYNNENTFTQNFKLVFIVSNQSNAPKARGKVRAEIILGKRRIWY